MAKKCEICGKSPGRGYSVSNANNHSKRVWNPNLKRVRVTRNGETKRIYACTKCIKSGKTL